MAKKPQEEIASDVETFLKDEDQDKDGNNAHELKPEEIEEPPKKGDPKYKPGKSPAEKQNRNRDNLYKGPSPDGRPTVPILGGSRRFGTFRRPVSIDLSQDLLPPITRKKTAHYEILSYEKTNPLIKEGDTSIDPPTLVIPGRYTIVDPFEPDLANNHKVVQNITGRERVLTKNPGTGRDEYIMQDRIDDVIMDRGFLAVNLETDYLLYCFLELHPLNASNKWRAKSQAAQFKRADLSFRAIAQETFDMDIALEAEKWVIDLEKDELINLAASLVAPISTINRPIHEIRYDMRIRARKEPRTILFVKGDQKTAIRYNLLDALQFTLIEYQAENRGFYFASDMREPFFTVPETMDPQEELANYFYSEEGLNDYNEILSMLNFWK